ncbi:MAG: hypothetical protein LUH05_03300, partial [Candidatus Gastranaerophilales bacterium]|nr:hypothetical protein [Candidatus Gastranaerophilales bacterium]
MKKIFNNIINWFKEYTLSFHIFNWVLPAIIPIIAVTMFFIVLKKLGLIIPANRNLILFMNISCQLLYFSFLLLINNIALYYLYDQKKQNNYFTLSILFSIMLLLVYIVATIFALSNCINCGIKSVAIIFIISIVTSCISIYMYSKNAKASFNIKNDESAKISEERKDKSKTLEDRIKSD